MSFDEYVSHMSQKYRLAVAISVIKSRPNNLSIEEYLTQLQNKINMEPDRNETVCSDDFNFDEEFITNEENQQSLPKVVNENEYHCRSNENSMDCFANTNSQNSQTILKDFVFNSDASRHGPSIVKDSNIGGTLKLLKGLTNDTEIEEQPVYQQDLSQTTFCESQEEPCINSANITFCYGINNNEARNVTNQKAKEGDINSQETELFSSQGVTQNYSYVSQTQGEIVVIDDQFIRSKVTNDIAKKIMQKNETGNVFNTQYYQKDRAQVLYEEADIEKDRNYKETERCVQVTNYIDLSNDNQTSRISDENNKMFDDSHALNSEMNNNSNGECNEMDTDGGSEHDSHAEIVPFKVLEELNKVRAFLNKRDGRSTGYTTDSGYRSDSQMRSSFRSSQLSGAWLNQSAHCLFTFIMQAPTGSDDIISEISQVLGQLIDKLHDEENYPSFLEELLETVDRLIQDTHEGDSGAENVLLNKDENIHRLVLLSKSKHILKHCIENITNILEKLQANLTNGSLCELTNITEIENVCYIFHVLEAFLKRYMKLRNCSSQASTQNSQDDERFPKRSSLTDLWRKKWNPNYKEVSKVQENITVCALKRCSEVLNKIIVECMDGYSLVAFAALQCFNVVQS